MAIVKNNGPQQAPGRPGLLTLEGMWEDDVTHQLSVRPLAELLKITGYASICPVRDVATEAELTHYLDRWVESDDLPVLYLAGHGEPGAVSLDGSTSVPLDRIASMLGGRARNRVIHIAACATMDVDEKVLQRFCRASGVTGLAGYTTDVDWTAAAAFDLILLGDLLTHTRVKPTYERLSRSFPDLVDRFGFRMSTATWTSPATQP